MRIRLFGILTLAIALAASTTQAQFPGGRPGPGPGIPGPGPGVPGHGYVNVPNPEMLLEHLVRHSDLLVTNINLTRASGFRVENVVIQKWMETPCWASNFYTDVIAAVRRPEDPDLVGFAVGQLVYQYRMKVIGLYDIAMNRGPSPELAAQWEQVNFAYFNAISATYFYIEALRRGFLLPQPMPQIRNRELLMRRLQVLERNAAEVQNLMYAIRYAQPFRFPIGRNCLECSFAPVRLQVAARGPQDVLFPYYANQRVMFPDTYVRRVEAPAQYNNMYTTEVWNNAWNTIDQGYLNPGAVNRGFGGGGVVGGGGGQITNGGVGFPQQGGIPAQGGPSYGRPYNPVNPGVNPGGFGGQQPGVNPNIQGQQPIQQQPAVGGPNYGPNYGPQPLNNGGQPAQLGGQQPGVNPNIQGQQPIQQQPGVNPNIQGQQPIQQQPTVQPQQQLPQQGTNTQPLPTMPQGTGGTQDYQPGGYDY